MCGITGIISFNGGLDPLDHIHAMTRALRHRGPDDEGYAFFEHANGRTWIYGGRDTPKSVYGSDYPYTPDEPLSERKPGRVRLALGHRRLSILDLSPAGHQPMCTPDGRYWIVYNGEIYNYLELRETLAGMGCVFQSNSDTEVLLHAYAQWREDALRKLVGMFAFALFDRQENRVFLARDFFGIKPLYYAPLAGGFAFASEIKSLLEMPGLKRSPNPQRVYEYLRFGLADHGEETLFQEIRQVPAAHWMTVSLDGRHIGEPRKYWDLNLDGRADVSPGQAARKVRDLFLDNVRLHLRSDVPVGAALSGGIDSSAIVMAMRRVQGSALSLHTFSYIAEEARMSEEAWVDLVGSRAGACVYKVRPTPRELMRDLDQLISVQDEPFGSTSIYAQYRVMRLTKEKGIKVMLDGQGSDELLGGYRPYFAARLASLIKCLRWGRALRFFLNLFRFKDYPMKTILMQTGGYFISGPLKIYAHRLSGMDLLPGWLEKDWFRERGLKIARPDKGKQKHTLRRELYRSLMEELLIGLLRYEDRNSMAFSIESRVPFLTPAFATFIFSLPEEQIIDMEGTTKWVFREAMRGIVPDGILDRKDKIGFATPEKQWLLHLRPWVEETLDGEVARRMPLFNLPAIKNEWRDVSEGRKPFDFQVWRWLNFIRWAEQQNIAFDA